MHISYRHSLLWLLICLPLTLQAATISEQVTSPLTTRGDALKKDNQLGDWAAFQWGGRLLVRAGDPVPLDGNPDPLRVAALELGGDLTLFNRVILHGLLLYEQQITDPPQVDELYLGVRLHGPMRLQAGRQYVPFGNFDTAMINMPLTQYLGETRAEALNLICECGHQHLTLYAANPDQTDTPIWGFNLGAEQDRLEGNLSWISNLAASGLFDGEHSLSGPAAAGAHLQWTGIRWVGHVEWIGALGHFQPSIASWRNRGARPQTLTGELRLRKRLFHHHADLAISYQRSWEAASFGLPESRWMATARWQLRANLTAAVEWMRSSHYSQRDGGNGRTDQRLTAELALTF